MADDMTCEEQINAILKAMPGVAVVVFVDSSYAVRAALVDKPDMTKVQATPCTNHPADAIGRLHWGLVDDAKKKHAMAGEHLSRLLTRIIPKEHPAAPTQSESEGT